MNLLSKIGGLFITFEKSAEKLGGTTQSLRLQENMKRAGIDVVLTRESGGTQVGQKLRSIQLDPDLPVCSASELFIQMADRAQHFTEVLEPNLRGGKVVISDRYFDSTLCYQGSARGWKTEFLLQLHQATTGGLIPDLTFVLDGVPQRALSKLDRIENAGSDFHRKVKERMLSLAASSDRYIVLNANRSEDDLAEEIFNLVKSRFPKFT